MSVTCLYNIYNPDETQRDLAQMVIRICLIKHPDADVDQLPEDVSIIVEGVEVLPGLKDVATACALLFGIIYDLNLSYPTELRYTYEFIQKILIELDTYRLSTKIQVLKNKLLAWMHEAIWLPNYFGYWSYGFDC